mgnify:CR=1 FL=1
MFQYCGQLAVSTHRAEGNRVATHPWAIRQMLQDMEIPVSKTLDGILHAAGPKQRRYKSQHRYSLDAWGVTEAEI